MILTLLVAGLLATPCGAPTATPLTQALWDGALGVAESACPTTRLSLGPEAYAIITPKDFYGQVRATLTLRGQLPLTDRLSLHARLELFRRQDVISAVTARYQGFGLSTLGVSYVLANGHVPLSLTTHVVLPTAFGLYERSKPVALDLGLNAALPLIERVTLYAHIGAVASASFAPQMWGERTGLVTTVGAGYTPRRWLTLVAEIRAAFGYDAPVDALSSGGAVRASYGAWTLSLEALLPWAGRERAKGSAGLSVSWTPGTD